jgi:hypothetical protein
VPLSRWMEDTGLVTGILASSLPVVNFAGSLMLSSSAYFGVRL